MSVVKKENGYLYIPLAKMKSGAKEVIEQKLLKTEVGDDETNPEVFLLIPFFVPEQDLPTNPKMFDLQMLRAELIKRERHSISENNPQLTLLRLNQELLRSIANSPGIKD